MDRHPSGAVQSLPLTKHSLNRQPSLVREEMSASERSAAINALLGYKACDPELVESLRANPTGSSRAAPIELPTDDASKRYGPSHRSAPPDNSFGAGIYGPGTEGDSRDRPSYYDSRRR